MWSMANAWRRLDGARDGGHVDVLPDQGKTGGQPGKVLLYLLNKFRNEDTVLRMTARKLTTRNPERRPSTLQVAASPSDVANVPVS